ncbi:hypothetical protein Tco_0257788 [Tanacetum coccineum]
MEMKDTLSSCSNSKEQQMQQIQDKGKKSCMVSFRKLHSHLKLLSNNDLKGTLTESGFKRAFAILFGQDIETYTGIMFLYVDQLEKQLDKEEFQEIGSMASLKKSIDERAKHKEEYNSWVNERKMQTTEDKVDSRNDAHADDAYIRPIYDEEPMAEVQTTAEIKVFAIGKQHTEQPEFNNEGEVDQNAEQCHDTCLLPATLTDNQTTELSNQSLEFENIRLKKTVAQFQKDFSRMEAHYVNLKLKYQNQVLKEGQHGQFLKVKSNEAKVKQAIEVVLQPTAFKSERPRFSKQRFASQVDVNNDLSKPVTTHYLPKERESAVVKPRHMIAPGSSRYSSNDMVHNHYLEEAKKKTQESSRNSEPSVIPSARSQSTSNGRIFKTIGLRWVPTGKIFAFSTNKVDSEPTNGSNDYITNQYECKQTLDVSAGFKEFSTNEQAMTSDHNSSELGIHDHSNEPSSSKLVPKVVPPAVKTTTS